MPALSLAAASLLGFLIGSIPNGFLIAKSRGVDIREHGSKNIGATNCLRVLGKGPGYLVFALDALKGVATILLGGWLTAHSDGGSGWRADHLGEILGAAFCILGHSFTPWLGFRGGKGVATSAGVLLLLFPPPVILTLIAVWVLVFYTSRYVSLASICAALALPVSVWFFVARSRENATPLLVFAILIGLLVTQRHTKNIQRLLAGTETRFVKKTAKTS